jgi:hypothetical protein
VEFDLVGAGYRLSLVKRRFVSGEFEDLNVLVFPEFMVFIILNRVFFVIENFEMQSRFKIRLTSEGFMDLEF